MPRAFEAERIDGRQDVGPKTDPVEIQVRCHSRLAVPAEIECQAVEAAPETSRERAERPAVEARRVDEESGRSVTAEIVQSHGDSIGGRGSDRRHRLARLTAGPGERWRTAREQARKIGSCSTFSRPGAILRSFC